MPLACSDACIFVIFLKAWLCGSQRKVPYAEKEYFIRAILISVLGYLFAGMFNDSMVVTAPVFLVSVRSGSGWNG